MLKTRLIAVVVIKGDVVVQSYEFRRYLPIGDPRVVVDYLNRWGVDEIVLLDIDATTNRRRPNFKLLEACAHMCHAPVAFGGGIASLDDVSDAIYSGADKVVINSAALHSPSLVTDGALRFGNQCIVAAIDARSCGQNRYEAYGCSGALSAARSPTDLAKRFEASGAGEILITSIDRDGSKRGYDLELIGQVQSAVSLPVIACGGVGHPTHFLDAVRIGVSGVAAANFFNHSEHSVLNAKRYLIAAGASVRLDHDAEKDRYRFDKLGRTDKKDDPYLDSLFIERFIEESI